MNLLEEHDHFSRLRSQHIDKLTKERKEREKQAKQKQRDILFAWKKEGEKGFSILQQQTNHLQTLLKPHRIIKECMLRLDSLASSSSSAQPSYIHTQSRILLWNIHHQQKHHKLYAKPMNLTELIPWRLWLQKEFLHVLDEDFHDISQRYYYLSRKTERYIYRNLFRYYSRQIHIDKKTLIELKKKRYTFRMAELKMKKIKDTQKQCDAINYCKSLQHYNPKGCSNCGVIFIGGSLEGAVPYVKSLSRDTGVATLVTLAFELETLANEEAVQIPLLEKVTKDLKEFEFTVYSNLVISLQRFWRIVLIWKRTLKKDARTKKSLYYYRIRRLVRMKREIDRLIKEPAPIDMLRMEDKYWDIINELREYVTLQEKLKHDRIVSFAKRFHFKLVVVVEEARERRYQEWLRLQSLPKPPRPIIIKPLSPKKKEVYICYRAECHLKEFLTHERYVTHMFVHKQQDYIKYYQHHLSHQKKLHKINLEQQLISNIDYVKSQLPTNEEHHLNISYPTATAVSTDLIHKFNLYRILTTSMFSLTLVSKSADVIIPGSEILLDQQVMRLGTHPSCECPIQIKGEIARLGMISKIHCLLYQAPPPPPKEEDEVDLLLKAKRGGKQLEDDEEDNNRDSRITIVDNSSLYGTYVVAKDGAMKVPTKVTKGLLIQNGSLICVGVTVDGPPMLPVSEANSACLVFRLQLVNV